MTVFKSFWRIVYKYKATVILYTVLLVFFAGINMTSDNPNEGFVASKPDIFIVNEDKNSTLTNHFVDYMIANSNFIEIENTKEAIADALFYRDVNCVIYIPKNYTYNILQGINTKISIQSSGDYMASFIQMQMNRYLKLQNMYLTQTKDENKLISLIDQNLKFSSDIIVQSSLDTNALQRVSTYFNFASYSIMAAIIFVICLVLSSFKEKTLSMRIHVSGMNYHTHNRKILFASFFYALIVWAFYIVLSFILFKDTMFNLRGLIYGFNALMFTLCSLTLALLISTIVQEKNAVSGIVNVIALGSAFLCGAFVPAEWLPAFVLKFAHVLPSYWYIRVNDLLKSIEVFNLKSLREVFTCFLMLFCFIVLFVIINNIASKKKQQS